MPVGILAMFITLYIYHACVYAATHVDGEYNHKRSMLLSVAISIILWASGFTSRAFGVDF
jgi:hypothetical protein